MKSRERRHHAGPNLKRECCYVRHIRCGLKADTGSDGMKEQLDAKEDVRGMEGVAVVGGVRRHCGIAVEAVKDLVKGKGRFFVEVVREMMEVAGFR